MTLPRCIVCGCTEYSACNYVVTPYEASLRTLAGDDCAAGDRVACFWVLTDPPVCSSYGCLATHLLEEGSRRRIREYIRGTIPTWSGGRVPFTWPFIWRAALGWIRFIVSDPVAAARRIFPSPPSKSARSAERRRRKPP